jgi:acyl dehydratase
VSRVVIESWVAGQPLPDFPAARIDRATLALFAGGSGDHNPLHIDTDFAREVAGQPDVIGQGMLTMAYLGRYVTALRPQSALLFLSARFVAMSRVGDDVICRGVVESVDGDCAVLSLSAKTTLGAVLATGRATVRLAA